MKWFGAYGVLGPRDIICDLYLVSNVAEGMVEAVWNRETLGLDTQKTSYSDSYLVGSFLGSVKDAS